MLQDINLREIMMEIPKIKLKDGKEYNTYDYYDFKKGLWISKVSIFDNKLVLNSNHFINLLLKYNDIYQETGFFKNNIIQLKKHSIYSRIIKNYYLLTKIKTNKDTNNIITINSRCIYIGNSFSSGNAGHDLFCILNVLTKYKKDKTIKFVVFDEINNNNTKIISLFLHKSRIIKIKEKTIYNFKRQIFIFEKDYFTSYDLFPIIKIVRNKIINLIKDKYKNTNELKNKNVILIKNSNQKEIVRYEDCFKADILFDYLKEKDWYICNPEKDDFFKMAYILLHAKTIITSQRGISCCNQIFYNLNANIIGFLKNTDNNFILVNNKYNLDPLCNGLYYFYMRKTILSPLYISNLLQLQNCIEEIENLHYEYKIKIYDNTRLSYNFNSFKTCEVNLFDLENKYKYGEKLPLTKCIQLLNNGLNLCCNQIVYNKKSHTFYSMIQQKFSEETGIYDNTDWVSIFKTEYIKNDNIKKIYIYDLEELDNICYSFPKLEPEMDLFDHFYYQLINNYNIVTDIKEADIAFIPIDFVKIIYQSPHESYSIVPENCPIRSGNIIGPDGIIKKYENIKFFWDKYVKFKLTRLDIPHFILYSYILFDIDFSYIPDNITIFSYENKISLFNDIKKITPTNNIIPIPYILNKNKVFNQSKITNFFSNSNNILSLKIIDIGYFGSIIGDHINRSGNSKPPDRNTLRYYRSFVKLLKFNSNIKFRIGKGTMAEKSLNKIKYLFVLRGDTESRLCFYQCFAFGVIPIIFEEEKSLYGNLLCDVNILDSCLIIPNIDYTNIHEYTKKITNIIEEEIKDKNNYLNKIKNHRKIFDNFNWFNNTTPNPVDNIIKHLSKF